MKTLPLFPVTMVGSWPRSTTLLKAQKLKRAGKIGKEEFEKLADDAVLEVLRIQEKIGVDIVTDGEQRRDNFYSFVAEKLDGVRMMTLNEMLDVIEDKASFEALLQTLDVPAYSLSNPTCVGKIERLSPLAVHEARFLKQHTKLPIKIPLPGPYILTRAMFVKEASRKAYPNKESLAKDVVRILRDEVRELIAEGVDFIQFDEPVLTEVVFTSGKTRTFMCASLAAGGDPQEELEFAATLLNSVIEGFEGTTFGLHVCRGNWSRDETTLLQGSYHPLLNHFNKIKVDQLVLEYATERAGDLMQFKGKSIGLGVVNPRTATVESPEEIIGLVKNALTMYPPEKIYLNPDCGFGTFSNSPVNDVETATKKMESIVIAARKLRNLY